MSRDPPIDEQTSEADDEEFMLLVQEHTLRLFGCEGWDDPAMDIYNDFDPRRQS